MIRYAIIFLPKRLESSETVKAVSQWYKRFIRHGMKDIEVLNANSYVIDHYCVLKMKTRFYTNLNFLNSRTSPAGVAMIMSQRQYFDYIRDRKEDSICSYHSQKDRWLKN